VPKIRAICAFLVVLAWLPASAHCALERVVLVPVAQCCCGGVPEAPLPDDCSQPVCSSVENGVWVSGERHLNLQMEFLLREAVAERRMPVAEADRPLPRVFPQLQPPDLSLWVLTHRAVGRARAPARTR